MPKTARPKREAVEGRYKFRKIAPSAGCQIEITNRDHQRVIARREERTTKQSVRTHNPVIAWPQQAGESGEGGRGNLSLKNRLLHPQAGGSQ